MHVNSSKRTLSRRFDRATESEVSSQTQRTQELEHVSRFSVLALLALGALRLTGNRA